MNQQSRKTRNKDFVKIQRNMAIIFGIVFALSMIPIFMIAPYVRATGDDLNYGGAVRHAVLSGQGLSGILCAVAATVRGTWYSWQGTWSSVALFSLQPGVWGDHWYPITILVGLICILAGTGYFLSVTGKRCGFSKEVRWSVFFLTSILMIQYMPNLKCGIFWWTSVAHYSIPYGIAMMCMGWSLRFLETGKWHFFLGMCIGMSYLGGAGYPEIVLVAVWFFGVTVYCLIRLLLRRSHENKRQGGKALLLLIPLFLEMAGFAVSAAAPGNKNRGGESFGFSVGKVLTALTGCAKEGILETAEAFVRVRPLLPVLLMTAVLLGAKICWEKKSLSRTRHKESTDQTGETKARYRGLRTIGVICAGMAVICLVHAPVLYAGVDPSGGVPDSYWFITLTAMMWMMEQILRTDRREDADIRMDKDCDQAAAAYSEWKRRLWVVASISALMVLLGRHLIGGSMDYVCIPYIQSGALADYHEQMEEWLTILNDPEIENAELPAMNDVQGPIMLMVPLEDPDAWSSHVYAQYYGKKSVICVPRAEK